MTPTPYEEARIRACMNRADNLGVAPFIAAEVAILHGHSLGGGSHGMGFPDFDEIEAAFNQWANQPKQP